MATKRKASISGDAPDSRPPAKARKIVPIAPADSGAADAKHDVDKPTMELFEHDGDLMDDEAVVKEVLEQKEREEAKEVEESSAAVQAKVDAASKRLVEFDGDLLEEDATPDVALARERREMARLVEEEEREKAEAEEQDKAQRHTDALHKLKEFDADLIDNEAEVETEPIAAGARDEDGRDDQEEDE